MGMWYSLGSMSSSKATIRTVILAAALLAFAMTLVFVVKKYGPDASKTHIDETRQDGPYRLVASESSVQIKMFGQKAGWIDMRIPLDSASVVVKPDGRLVISPRMRWSQAHVTPEAYAGSLMEVFRPGRALENRLEFELSEVPLPAPGTTTQATSGLQVLLYGQRKTREADVKISRGPDRLYVVTATLITMSLDDFKASKLANLMAVQSGAKVSPLMELHFDLVFEPTISTQAP